MSDRWVFRVLVSLLCVVICLAVGSSVIVARARSQCLRAGYPEARMPGFTAYCVRRVNMTDEVIPLSTLDKKP